MLPLRAFLEVRLEASWLGRLGRLLGSLWALLGLAWEPLGPSWGNLGGIFGALGPILSLLENFLEASWVVLGRLGGFLGEV